MVKNLPASARDMGSITGRGTKIPYAVGQPRPCPATREAHALEPEPATREACRGRKTQHSQKKKPNQKPTKTPKPMGYEVKKTGI